MNQSLTKTLLDVQRTILEKNNVVHVHSNNQLTKSSRIEKHLRKCAEQQAAANQTNQNESAFICTKLPIMVSNLTLTLGVSDASSKPMWPTEHA